MSSPELAEREDLDPLVELRAELEPILSGIDWTEMVTERDRVDRERMFARIRSKLSDEHRMQQILAVMAVLTVT